MIFTFSFDLMVCANVRLLLLGHQVLCEVWNANQNQTFAFDLMNCFYLVLWIGFLTAEFLSRVVRVSNRGFSLVSPWCDGMVNWVLIIIGLLPLLPQGRNSGVATSRAATHLPVAVNSSLERRTCLQGVRLNTVRSRWQSTRVFFFFFFFLI